MIRRRARSARPEPATTTTTEEFGAELVVYCERTQRMHCLDPQASVIWALCDGSRNVERIVREVATVYGVDRNVIRGDVESAVDRFRELGLLR